MGHLEVEVALVHVADDGQPIGANGDRTVGSDVADGVDRGGGGVGTRRIDAVGDLEVAVARDEVVVAHDREDVACHRDRREEPGIPGVVDRGDGDGGALQIVAVGGHLEVEAGSVEARADGQAVRAHGDRRAEADLAVRVRR
ncbi:MAG: hypothetical protein ACRD0A_08920 [Acidimicrobiales bacterium]